jgi:hypothetical protein
VGGGGGGGTSQHTRLYHCVGRALELKIHTRVHKITNVPVVYMVRDVVILRRANPFLGRFEGVGPESLDICGPQIALA